MAHSPKQLAREWYNQNSEIYSSLRDKVQRLLTDLLNREPAAFLSVTGRLKSLGSLESKVARKGYREPRREVSDLAGIRVIAYTESDVLRIANLIRNMFFVHKDKSLDKSEELGIDRVGYRSIHFVCELSEDRCRLPEFRQFTGLLFEIQVRTVLQHAWAEIDHDRGYNISGQLPIGLQRRLRLISAVLELADREFDAVVHEVDRYERAAIAASPEEQLRLELNSTSLRPYLAKKLPSLFGADVNLRSIEVLQAEGEVISELLRFGMKKLFHLDALLNRTASAFERSYLRQATVLGFLRDAMMLDDIHRYLDECVPTWSATDSRSVSIWKRRYGDNIIDDMLAKHGIIEFDEEDSGDPNALIISSARSRHARSAKPEGKEGDH